MLSLLFQYPTLNTFPPGFFSLDWRFFCLGKKDPFCSGEKSFWKVPLPSYFSMHYKGHVKVESWFFSTARANYNPNTPLISKAWALHPTSCVGLLLIRLEVDLKRVSFLLRAYAYYEAQNLQPTWGFQYLNQ